MKKIFLSMLVFILFSCAHQEKTAENHFEFPYSETHIDFKKWNRDNTCCEARGKKAAIASGGTYSSKSGIEILKQGGNAVDAAIAVAFALAVERPHSAGLGGGGFMTLSLPGKGQYFIDFREEAPMRAQEEMYLDAKGEVISDLSVKGAKSIAVPGFVPGLFSIHKRFGRLKWEELLKPAIDLAEKGFPIYPSLEKHINEEKDCLLKEEATKKILFDSKGEGLKIGNLLIQSDLGKTLRVIAKEGDKSFRTGEIAKKIVEYTKARGGILTLEDMKSYQVKFREPVRFKFQDYTFISAPPPSAGGALIGEILNLLDQYDIQKLLKNPGDYFHLLAESMRLAYADRSFFIGDPDFTKMNYQKLLSKEYAKQQKEKINFSKANHSSDIKPGELEKPSGTHTTHLSIIDSDENAVSSTLTINDTFGSCLVAEGTGIFLNDEMDDFSVKPGAPNIYGLIGNRANSIQPKKRPASSMSPTIVFKDGEPILAVGAAGGSRITTSVLQVILNYLLVYPGDLKKAEFAPRIHHQWKPDELSIEKGMDHKVIEALQSKGHQIVPPPFVPQVQAVSRTVYHGEEMGAVFDVRDEGGVSAW